MRRSRLLLAVLGIAVVAVVAAVVVSGLGSSKPQPYARAVPAVESLLRGIPQSGTTLGSARAPVTLTFFGDLECPVCRQFALDGGLPEMIRRGVRPGLVKLVYRSFCSATCAGPGKDVFYAQQVAAYAAGTQRRFWDYAELFYREQGAEGSGYVTPAFLRRLARAIPGLDFGRWQQHLSDRGLLAQVVGDNQTAAELHLVGTPTVIVGGPKGVIEVNAVVPSYAQLAEAVARVA